MRRIHPRRATPSERAGGPGLFMDETSGHYDPLDTGLSRPIGRQAQGASGRAMGGGGDEGTDGEELARLVGPPRQEGAQQKSLQPVPVTASEKNPKFKVGSLPPPGGVVRCFPRIKVVGSLFSTVCRTLQRLFVRMGPLPGMEAVFAFATTWPPPPRRFVRVSIRIRRPTWRFRPSAATILRPIHRRANGRPLAPFAKTPQGPRRWKVAPAKRIGQSVFPGSKLRRATSGRGGSWNRLGQGRASSQRASWSVSRRARRLAYS